MMQHHSTLTKVLRPTGERDGFFRQFLDQALLVRSDNVLL
jgi:hypothetical protein